MKNKMTRNQAIKALVKYLRPLFNLKSTETMEIITFGNGINTHVAGISVFKNTGVFSGWECQRSCHKAQGLFLSCEDFIMHKLRPDYGFVMEDIKDSIEYHVKNLSK